MSVTGSTSKMSVLMTSGHKVKMSHPATVSILNKDSYQVTTDMSQKLFSTQLIHCQRSTGIITIMTFPQMANHNPQESITFP
jgi:hypothetical protein